ncbi:MAG: acyl carrier protein [Thermodesulfovibrionia bacterium]|nr:acyl carrier protein [Thermodesulfovibrionia bacterium]
MKKDEATKNIVNADKNAVEDKIKGILVDRFGFDISDIKSSSLLKDDLGIDSFDALRIVFEVENEFDIDIPRKGIFNIRNVKDIVNYISKRVNEKS